MTTYSLMQSIHTSSVHEDTILLDSETGVYLSLNSTASFFFMKLCNGASAREAIDAISGEFEDLPIGFESEFERLLQMLLEKNILTVRA